MRTPSSRAVNGSRHRLLLLPSSPVFSSRSSAGGRIMSLLRMMEERLPPGFRFHPRDEELVCDYLEKKVSAANSSNNGSYHDCSFQMLIDVDLNKCEPWDLPELACVGGKEWYFFNLRDRKYSTGQRTNRATQSGYWKATGKDRLIMRKQMLVGMRKTLVFYHGRAPKGKKTDWVMHEFRMETINDSSNFTSKEDWVLCRVSFKNRSTVPKQVAAATNPFHHHGSSSSSLPPLVHTNISFDHEIPCISNPLAVPTGTVARQLVPPQHPAGHLNGQSAAGMGPHLMSSQANCDRKMIKAVLCHLSSKLEGDQKTLGDGGAAESYLSPEAAAGLQNMW